MDKKEKPTISKLIQTNLFVIIDRIEVYDNVILVYDQDNDVRLKPVVDRINNNFKDYLYLIYECDGTLLLIWKEIIPNLYKEGNSIAAIFPNDTLQEYIDYWDIGKSIILLDFNDKFAKKEIPVKKSYEAKPTNTELKENKYKPGAAGE